MSSAAQRAVDRVREALRGRRLVWNGIRGEDGEPLGQLPELAASLAVIAPLRSGSVPPDSNITYEHLSGARPDLDRPDLDIDTGAAADRYRAAFLRELDSSCVLMTYRPSDLTTALAFSMSQTTTLAGMLRDRQSAFEHKPWVERSLAARGVRGLGWRYIADEHRARAKRYVAGGPQILRASRASGGFGIVAARTADDVDRYWPEQSETFVAVAPYLTPSVPVNLSGVVFGDGSVRLHPPSVQLIGIPACTNRPFGYCGNDFAAAAELDGAVLGQLDDLARAAAAWLAEERYLGVFGVDALVRDGLVHFTEINPRFQGSSALSADIAQRLEVPDLYLDHLAAHLGLPPVDEGRSIRDWARAQPAVAQVVVHNTAGMVLVRDLDTPLPERPPRTRLGHLARDVRIDPGATLCRVTIPHAVTRTGFEIDDGAMQLARSLHGAFAAPAPEDSARDESGA